MVAIRTLAAFAGLFSGLVAALPASEVRRSTGGSVDSDGFPNPNSQQLLAINKQADGMISNAPPPPKLANSSLTAFQLIRFNENFEVAFFKSLLYNVTNDVPGYEANDKQDLVNILRTVIAQEELHSISADTVLTHFGAFSPPPCIYHFPTTNIKDALTLAETFTAVVLGTLQDASQLFAKNGDNGPVRTVASVIGQEGEQNGFYRALLGLKPSAQPFLTTSVAPFAFSALQNFVTSCPFDLNLINLTRFQPLNVVSGDGGANVAPQDQTLTFSADFKDVVAAEKYKGSNGGGLFVTYLMGQNVPASEPVSNVRWSGSVVTFDAFFPFNANTAFGLSIAALTTSGNFATPDDVPGATLVAPGLIQVNDRFM